MPDVARNCCGVPVPSCGDPHEIPTGMVFCLGEPGHTDDHAWWDSIRIGHGKTPIREPHTWLNTRASLLEGRTAMSADTDDYILKNLYDQPLRQMTRITAQLRGIIDDVEHARSDYFRTVGTAKTTAASIARNITSRVLAGLDGLPLDVLAEAAADYDAEVAEVRHRAELADRDAEIQRLRLFAGAAEPTGEHS